MASNQVPEDTTLGQYGGFVSRLIAYWIDQAIISGIFALITLAISYVVNLFGLDERLSTWQYAGVLVLVLTLLIVLLVGAIYQIGFWMLAGQTPGKRLLGLRVVRTDGERVGFWSGVRRWLGYMVSSILFLGYLWILVDNRRQGFHDKIAGTMVVYSWPEGEQMGTFIRDRAREFRQR